LKQEGKKEKSKYDPMVKERPVDNFSNIHSAVNLAAKWGKEKAGFQQLLIFG
jgi:hypothetical protein